MLTSSGAIETAIGRIAERLSGREILLIPVIMMLFGLGAATFGMFEEGLPFILLLIPVAMRLGFDSLVGTAMVLVGLSAGFTSAFMNPFTVGVAQGIAELPLFSGIVPRIFFFLIFMAVAIAYVMVYAIRVKRRPEISPVRREDEKRLASMPASDIATQLTGAQKASLLILLVTLAVLIFGVLRLEWYITEIAGLFLLMGIAIGIANRYGANGMAERFVAGCQDIAVGALCVGFAYGTLVILQDAQTIDTILQGITNAVRGLPSELAAVGMLVLQSFFNLIVASGSGQAALTMPLMTPVSDLLGIDRQVAVLAFQMGDGITNIISPTSGLLLAALAMAKLNWWVWAKWVWPLMVIQLGLAAVFVTVAQMFIWTG